MAGINRATLTPPQQQALQALEQWDKHFDANSNAATLFNAWWIAFFLDIWVDDFGGQDRDLRFPSRDRTIKLLLTEKTSPWFDNIFTPKKETSNELLHNNFVRCVDSLTKQYGKFGNGWNWSNDKGARIQHLGNIDAFGSGRFSAGGASTTVDALSADFGPSWRMVVQMGPQVKGYGVFPGGQSGNPGSFYYDNLFSTWKEGKLNELIFLQSKEDAPASTVSTLILQKK
jgi:penicillin G amidase